LDFDWEYPCGDFKTLYTQFIQGLREAVHQALGDKFLLTTAVGAGKNTIDNCYEIGKLGQLLDLIHLMTYDFHCKIFLENEKKSLFGNLFSYL
jgi:GH18 family chitinase